jgi:hypothetical protein
MELQSNAVAWHYTTGNKASQILQSGYLNPATGFVSPPERPILWFSSNQFWEATANKGIMQLNGVQRAATLEEMAARAGGLVRFGCPLDTLKPASVLRIEARMSYKVYRALCEAAHKVGSNPSEWYGTLSPMSIEGMFFQVMNCHDERTSWQWPAEIMRIQSI